MMSLTFVHMAIDPVYVAKYPVTIQLLFSNPFRLSVMLVRDELTIVTSKLERKNPINSLSKDVQ